MKSAMRLLVCATWLGLAGCETAPDAAEQRARREAEPLVTLPAETGSRIARKVRASELGSHASTAAASPVGSVGGDKVRDTKTTLGDALVGP